METVGSVEVCSKEAEFRSSLRIWSMNGISSVKNVGGTSTRLKERKKERKKEE
jgi:hypothetical protein